MPDGCTGEPSGATDYCYDPLALLAYNQDINQDLRDPAFSYTNPFRLKLYWEEGYFWQEEPNERECRFVAVLI
jgi:hypothetical protein